MKNIKTDYLSIFEHICTIPHGSGNTKKVAEFCRDFALFHRCTAEIDEIGNVIIKCNASKGYENRPIVILQGHTDMVCEKTVDSTHNFENDPLKLIYENGFLRADGTTLGGDDSIAVAYCLSIIANKNIKHPPLEILLTTDEETGLYGANALDGSKLDGRLMINIDSEEEGILLSGCAGGLTASFNANYNQVPCNSKTVKLSINGLAGGHSGADIHKKRLNAVKVLSNICSILCEKGFQIVEFDSGSKMNAIPFSGYATLAVAEDFINDIPQIVENFIYETTKNKSSDDDNPKIIVEFTQTNCFKALSLDDSKKFINFINKLPDGIISYTSNDHRLVETSLNIGVCNYFDGLFNGTSLLRSSVNSDLDALSETICNLCEKFGVSITLSDRYPAWEYRKTSVLRDKMCDIYKGMFGTELKVDVIHAGLECGILSDKLPGLDCVSIGPNILDIHTSNERLDLASAERCYKFILKVLEDL